MTQRKKFKRPDGTLNPPQGYDELADEFVRLRDEYFPDWTDGANWKVMPYDGTRVVIARTARSRSAPTDPGLWPC